MHTLNDVELIFKKSGYKKDLSNFILYMRGRTVMQNPDGNTLYFTADLQRFLRSEDCYMQEG